MKYIRFSFLLFTLLAMSLIACKEESKMENSDSYDGVFEQLGYGRIAKITDGEFVLYDTTEISCLPVMDGSIDVFGNNLSIQNDTLQLKDGINDYRFIRLDKAPELCTQDISDLRKQDPQYNFEVLASYFDEHYAYFDLRKVNWDSLYTATKSKIRPETSSAELYIILEDMLDSFKDGHIGLEATEDMKRTADSLRNIGVTEVAQATNTSYGDLEIARMVSKNYLKGNLQSSQSELVNWGMMTADLGYIQINLMMGHAQLKLADSLIGMPYLRAYFNELEDLTSEAHTQLEVIGIRGIMDEALADLSTSSAIILDVRFNGGGKDEVGMEIIRSFNPIRHKVFTKKARFGDGYTKTNEVFLEGFNRPYVKPIYLLTSPQSASATEIMVMSSLLLENVTRIGGHTEGVFSDVLDKVLPNGWEVGLSNEVYLDTENVNYEGKGIPATIELGYPETRQEFFRQVAKDLENDKRNILDIVLKKIH